MTHIALAKALGGPLVIWMEHVTDALIAPEAVLMRSEAKRQHRAILIVARGDVMTLPGTFIVISGRQANSADFGFSKGMLRRVHKSCMLAFVSWRIGIFINVLVSVAFFRSQRPGLSAFGRPSRWRGRAFPMEPLWAL